jgi:hypothetical protein
MAGDCRRHCLPPNNRPLSRPSRTVKDSITAGSERLQLLGALTAASGG